VKNLSGGVSRGGSCLGGVITHQGADDTLKTKGIYPIPLSLTSERVMSQSFNLQKKNTIDLDYVALEMKLIVAR
jgi:hypothetical protein